MKIYPFHALTTCPLVIDALYEGGSAGNLSSEVISKLLSATPERSKSSLKVHNAGGFRYRGTLPSPLIVALTSDDSEPAWPDTINPYTGHLTYFGDNRSPGELHETHLGGNRILAESFARFRQSASSRLALPVFLYFTRWQGFTQQFRGLVVPGASGLRSDDELATIWRTKDGARFQNYRATFTVLNVPQVSRDWITDILLGRNKLVNAPTPYRNWVEKGKYDPLVAANVIQTRSKEEQLPVDVPGKMLVSHIHQRFGQKSAHEFEPIALALWGMQSGIPMEATLTRRSVDGGRDAYGVLRIGPKSDPLGLDFALEAKCYAFDNSVGVKETSRLISRLRRHHFGVLVTTSYIAKQAYEELREDGHPVVLMTASDIARVLQENGIDDTGKLDAWIDRVVA